MGPAVYTTVCLRWGDRTIDYDYTTQLVFLSREFDQNHLAIGQFVGRVGLDKLSCWWHNPPGGRPDLCAPECDDA